MASSPLKVVGVDVAVNAGVAATARAGRGIAAVLPKKVISLLLVMLLAPVGSMDSASDRP